jgi:hypothetical protein
MAQSFSQDSLVEYGSRRAIITINRHDYCKCRA